MLITYPGRPFLKTLNISFESAAKGPSISITNIILCGLNRYLKFYEKKIIRLSLLWNMDFLKLCSYAK